MDSGLLSLRRNFFKNTLGSWRGLASVRSKSAIYTLELASAGVSSQSAGGLCSRFAAESRVAAMVLMMFFIFVAVSLVFGLYRQAEQLAASQVRVGTI